MPRRVNTVIRDPPETRLVGKGAEVEPPGSDSDCQVVQRAVKGARHADDMLYGADLYDGLEPLIIPKTRRKSLFPVVDTD